MRLAEEGVQIVDEKSRDRGSRDSGVYWAVERVEYVDRSVPLRSSLFDNPDRLNNALDAAHDSLVSESPSNRDERHRRDEAVIRGANRLLGPYADVLRTPMSVDDDSARYNA